MVLFERTHSQGLHYCPHCENVKQVVETVPTKRVIAKLCHSLHPHPWSMTNGHLFLQVDPVVIASDGVEMFREEVALKKQYFNFTDVDTSGL